MKAFILVVLAGLTLNVASAQKSSKNKSKQKVESQEQMYAKRQNMMNEQRMQRLEGDSMRKSQDSLDNAYFDSTRIVYRDSTINYQDSSQAVAVQSMSKSRQGQMDIERAQQVIFKKAKLSSNQQREADFINSNFMERYEELQNNETMSLEEQKAKLMTLNEQRKIRIKAVLGKSRAKKLERARKSYLKENGSGSLGTWETMLDQ